MSKAGARFITLEALLARHKVNVDRHAVTSGRVFVNGRVVLNPNARVPANGAVRVRPQPRLRGDVKLSLALDRFGVLVTGRTAVDIGASSGGFTTSLLRRGARRVYAIDAGVGQLLGSLRVDARVINLEGHNLGSVTTVDVPDEIQLITIDLSYLAVAEAVPQLEGLRIARDGELVALVKPMFELRRASPPTARHELEFALRTAVDAVNSENWEVVATCESGVRGARGTVEFFVHARRAGGSTGARP